MASSLSPTGTLTVGTSPSASTSAEPSSPATAIEVVVAGAAVVGVGATVVGTDRWTSSETSASISMKSSRSWMISTRSVSNSSSLVSSSPQPEADSARAVETRAVGRRVRVSMAAVFQSGKGPARRPASHFAEKGRKAPLCRPRSFAGRRCEVGGERLRGGDRSPLERHRVVGGRCGDGALLRPIGSDRVGARGAEEDL